MHRMRESGRGVMEFEENDISDDYVAEQMKGEQGWREN